MDDIARKIIIDNNNSGTGIVIHSDRMDRLYHINRFTEYRVDIDLEVDSDGFNMVFSNVDGMYTGIFNEFDRIWLYVNKRGLLKGIIDSVRYVSSSSVNEIQIIGRDMMSVFVDSDCTPGQKKNVNPKKWIENKCDEYGILKYNVHQVPIEDKLVVGTGESEMSIMNNLLMESRKRIWYIFDTLYCGHWSTNDRPSYVFARGVKFKGGEIPIEGIDYKSDGTRTKSKVVIYGNKDDGKNYVAGVADNDYLQSRGIKRVETIRSSRNDSTSKYASSALRRIREGMRDDIELIVKVMTTNRYIIPNTTAQVIDDTLKINDIFFIKSVSYEKSVNGGSITTIVMIPGDTTFDVVWYNQGNKKTGRILGTPGTSVEDLLHKEK